MISASFTYDGGHSSRRYDFTYFSVDFAVDVSVVSVSSGKSMLPFETSLPLQLAAEAAPIPAELSSSEWLGAARTYLGLVSRAQHHLAGMAESLTQALQDDFVAARKADPKVSGEDFGRWLTLTRLVAASGLAEAVEFKHYECAPSR